jgi:preprotein translocase subunit SecA
LPTFSPDIDQFNREQLVQHNTAIQANPSCMNLTDQIFSDLNSEYVQIAPLNLNNQGSISVYSDMLQQMMPNFQMKQENVKPQSQQTYHQKIKAVQNVKQQSHFQANTSLVECNQVVNEPNWESNDQQMDCFVQQSELQGQHLVSHSPNMMQEQISPDQPLPKDLENLNTFFCSECDLNDIDEIIRKERFTSNDL